MSTEKHGNELDESNKTGKTTIDTGSDPGTWAEHQAFLEMKKKMEQKLFNNGEQDE